MNRIFEIPPGYATYRDPTPPTVSRRHECSSCGWTGFAEFTWNGETFVHDSCPNHVGSPFEEWS